MKKTLVLSCLLGTLSLSYAETLNQIIIQGNRRIEKETIKSYIPVKVGENFSQNTADLAIKSLFKTGFFSDVKVIKKGASLEIIIKENPIIKSSCYEGNDYLKDDQIAKDLPLKPRKILSDTDVQNAQQRILEIYRRMGRYSAKVEPKIIRLDDNKVNLVFEIHEGSVTHIEKIIFLGNNTFSTSTLEEKLLSKRSKWWRFFATDDVYDPDRLMADQQALRQFYVNNGYPDFRIVNAVAELTQDQKEFYLTFTVDEGKYYKFGNIDIKSTMKNIDIDGLFKDITFSKGDMYSAKEIDKTINILTDALGDKGYAFVAIEPSAEKNRETNEVSITFKIKEAPRIYIERIDIKGNDRTHDHVIRRELTFHEGDAYNTAKIKHSESKIKDLDFFKMASVEPDQGTAPDKAKITVNVEEQSTGSIKLSGGFSTLDGPILGFGFSERNFMGKGQTLHSDVSLAKKAQEFNIGIVEPYLFNRPLMGSFDIYTQRSSRNEAFSTRTIGFGTGIGYNLTANLIQKLNYSFHTDKISSIDENSSVFLRDEPKKSVTSSIAHTLRYDKRDSVIDPTRGYVLNTTNTFSGVGGNVSYIRNDFTTTVFYSPLEQVLTFVKLDFGRVDKVGNKKMRISDCIYLGGDSFKGFEYGGIGPRDILSKNSDALGGQKYWKITLESQFPIGVPADFGVKGTAYTEFGSLWSASVKNAPNVKGYVLDNKKVRLSIGLGIIWKGPFGPLRIDYALPILKSKIDKTQRINLSYALPI